MDKILEYNEFNDFGDWTETRPILEMGRLNDTNLPGIVINGYSQVPGGRSEHGLPHFDIKFKTISLGSFLIPTKSEWNQSHDIKFFKGYKEKEALKYKGK